MKLFLKAGDILSSGNHLEDSFIFLNFINSSWYYFYNKNSKNKEYKKMFNVAAHKKIYFDGHKFIWPKSLSHVGFLVFDLKFRDIYCLNEYDVFLDLDIKLERS